MFVQVLKNIIQDTQVRGRAAAHIGKDNPSPFCSHTVSNPARMHGEMHVCTTRPWCHPHGACGPGICSKLEDLPHDQLPHPENHLRQLEQLELVLVELPQQQHEQPLTLKLEPVEGD